LLDERQRDKGRFVFVAPAKVYSVAHEKGKRIEKHFIMSIVLVTAPELRRGSAVFKSATAVTCLEAPPAEDALADAIRASGARHVVVGGTRYRDQLYSSLSTGGVIARFGVGYDNIDRERATAAGLLCTNTPGVLDQSVAELTLSLIAAAARHVPAMAAQMSSGTWAQVEGTELRERTLTLVGCGRIGSAVARIASRGFEMRVIGYRRPGASSPPPAADFDATTEDIGEAIGQADFVSLHIPAGRENTHFINRERLSFFQPHSWLINTARGAVVDEIALFDALADHRLGGVAADVFDREPYQPAEPGRDLRTLPNVILLPHVGSHTVACNRRMAQRALGNILLAEAGNFEAMDLINPDVLRLGSR
jgi:phosphoglycerate dehydrogenase-like enzyme